MVNIAAMTVVQFFLASRRAVGGEANGGYYKYFFEKMNNNIPMSLLHNFFGNPQ
jgi:hypothetical protein